MKGNITRHLRTLICCGVLETGALFGIPMRMEEIERLLRSLSGPGSRTRIPRKTNNRGR